jgi:hypothetical protein
MGENWHENEKNMMRNLSLSREAVAAAGLTSFLEHLRWLFSKIK